MQVHQRKLSLEIQSAEDAALAERVREQNAMLFDGPAVLFPVPSSVTEATDPPVAVQDLAALDNLWVLGSYAAMQLCSCAVVWLHMRAWLAHALRSVPSQPACRKAD